jgi:hypothetical protein
LQTSELNDKTQVMKTMLFLFFLPAFAIAQNGKVSGDTLILNSTLFIKGQAINIGQGSKANGGYAYLFVAPASAKEAKNFVSPSKSKVEFLNPGWKGMKMFITGFQLAGNKQSGMKYYLLLSGGENYRYMCDPEMALNTKEVL